MLKPEIWLFKGVYAEDKAKQKYWGMFETQNSGNKSDSCIPVISVSIDLPVHVYLYPG